MVRQLRIQGKHYDELKAHLYPGDDKEAVAVILCGRHESATKEILLSHEILLIPHNECDRDTLYVSWKTNRVLPFFEKVEKRNFALVKIHSHPNGQASFSETDDVSDAEFFRTAFNWSEKESIHASAIMLPDGSVFGRAFLRDLRIAPLDRISVAGDYIHIWDQDKESAADSFAQRTIQAFGEGTYAKLKSLKVAVIGCSGTGSPVIEELTRLGVGKIVLIDPDVIESKNLNRIINSTAADVGRSKVDVLAQAIQRMGLGTEVIPFAVNLYDSVDARMELIDCDVLIGCVDSVEGRHLVSQIANFYLIPYLDMGIRLDADGTGGISLIVGSVNYIQPGMSSLMSRNLYNSEDLRAENIYRTNPEAYKEQLESKYVKGVKVDRPAVVSVNTLIASAAVMELLDKLHGFKDEPSARIMVDFTSSCIENIIESKFEPDPYNIKYAGRGDCEPFLQMPAL